MGKMGENGNLRIFEVNFVTIKLGTNNVCIYDSGRPKAHSKAQQNS